jgi:2-oxoglutarate ferredoxin oxidoreductase subunit gamma
VLYPYVTRPDILVVMSQEAYSLFTPQLKENGLLIIEQDMVRIDGLPPGVRVYSVPATRLAEELGKRMVLNIVMVGFFGAVSGLLKPESLRNAIADSVPKAFVDLNLKAFDKGYEYGLKSLNGTVESEEQPIEVGVLES